jgi:hypothetical protein
METIPHFWLSWHISLQWYIHATAALTPVVTSPEDLRRTLRVGGSNLALYLGGLEFKSGLRAVL